MHLRALARTTTPQAQTCMKARAAYQPPVTISLKRSYFNSIEKIYEKTNGGNATNLFRHFKRKHTVDFNQAMKAREQGTRAAVDVRPRSKQMAQLSIAGASLVALASGFPYDKSKQWMKSTDAVTYPCLRCIKQGRDKPAGTLPSGKFFASTKDLWSSRTTSDRALHQLEAAQLLLRD